MKDSMKHLLVAKCYTSKNQQVSTGCNLPLKTHPLQAKLAAMVGLPEKQCLHAEVLALLRAKDKPVHRLTVERYGLKSGKMLLAKPCLVCQKALEIWGVSVVEYTTPTGWKTEELT